jgi:hypothetical protein
MSSYLRFDGVYDPRRNFAITNWSDEDYVTSWTSETTNAQGLVNGVDIEYVVKAGEVKTFPMYLAYHITMGLVDREMYKIAAALPADTKERERAEMAVANKDTRKPFEDKTLKEVIAGEEAPEVTAMRKKLRAELRAEGKIYGPMSSEMNQNPDGTPQAPAEEFPDVPQKNKVG